MKNIITTNETLVKMTNNITLAKAKRNEAVQIVLSDIIAYGKEHAEIFTDGKKGAVASFVKNVMNDKSVDAYTKRCVKVSKAIIDGHKIKKELLSLAQMEQLICFNKAQVNAIMKFEGDEYIAEAKELINKGKIEKTTKVFSSKKARAV